MKIKVSLSQKNPRSVLVQYDAVNMELSLYKSYILEKAVSYTDVTGEKRFTPLFHPTDCQVEILRAATEFESYGMIELSEKLFSSLIMFDLEFNNECFDINIKHGRNWTVCKHSELYEAVRMNDEVVYYSVKTFEI